MLNSMYSGISGLGANQKKLDVIGNNVANSGTTSFKSSSVTFQDSMYQSYKGASGPGLNLGGVNPSRVGMGVSIQSIVTNMAQGSLQPTGRPYDVAVDGTGYFIVAKGKENGTITVNADQSMESTTLESFYTRDGSFKVDSKGNLLNSNGYRIMGYAISDGTATSPLGGIVNYVDGESENLNANQNELVALKIPETVSKLVTDKDGNPEVGADGKPTGRREDVRIQGFSIENDGLIKAVLADGSTTVLGQVAMASFTNNEGLEQKGNNMYSPSANSGNPLARVGKYTDKAALGGREDNGKAYGQVLNGFLEMSNVDLSAQFTDMIVATRSFQACGKIITTADEILQELVNLKR
ncbi:MAG: flagellar hook-basal body complex protein [Clostridium sulfidigenes]|uniref:Flagellar hook protein FlgE n=1 Tax=Clostridium sulfidigenes TaxID=318464 RepID=A0A927W741_9CLOT|nr:flagellar hook-basal body complex protein [Clostridium sulfidigenes]